MKGLTCERRNARVTLRASLRPAVWWSPGRSSSGPPPAGRGAVARHKGVGDESVLEARDLAAARKLAAVGRWVLGPSSRSGPSRPSVSRLGGRGRMPCCGSARRCPRGRAGRRHRRPVNRERGKRPGGAHRALGLGGRRTVRPLPSGDGGGRVQSDRKARRQHTRNSECRGRNVVSSLCAQ